MKIRTTAVAVTLAASALFGGAFAEAASATSLTPTTTTVTASNPVGTRPGKLVVIAKVKPTTGTAIATGSCSIVIDTRAAISRVLNSRGHCSITTHVKLGSHTVTVTYSGSTTLAASSGGTTIVVTH